MVKIELNDEEQKAYIQLLDIALKSQGINALDGVYYFKNKLNQAIFDSKNQQDNKIVEPKEEDKIND
jgi:hypothetical protein